MANEGPFVPSNAHWDDLIWRLAIVIVKLHDGVGDRQVLLVERAEVMREAKEVGLFKSRYGDA